MQIKILDLNMYDGGLLWENVVPFFNREQPDIFCLQEVFDSDTKQPPSFQTLKRLRSLLPEYDFYYSPELHETWPHGAGDTGNAVFSRFPIVRKETHALHRQYERIVRPKDEKDFSHYPKNMQHVVVPVNNKELHVFNLHGVWGLEGADNPERLAMSKKIIDKVKDFHPAVLMGDFNVRPNTKTIEDIEKHMTNVFKGKFTTTFNMRHKTNPGYATAVVDMFFVSPDMKIISSASPEDDVSDHKPLVVTIEI